MCRVAGYLGTPEPLSGLVDRPSHSLHKQSYAARELETSVVSADGWGAAWYLPGDLEPCIYRSTLPIWGDVNRLDLGRATRSHCLLAAVRSATDPVSISAGNTQPFRFERLCFVHNGFVERFRHTLRRPVCQRLSDPVYRNVAGDTDSEHLFALIAESWLAATASEPHERLVSAVRSALGQIRALARRAELKALLTVLVTDGQSLIAARAAENARSPTLYFRHLEASGQTWFASEPLETNQDWESIDDDGLVVARREGPLERRSLG